MEGQLRGIGAQGPGIVIDVQDQEIDAQDHGIVVQDRVIVIQETATGVTVQDLDPVIVITENVTDWKVKVINFSKQFYMLTF